MKGLRLAFAALALVVAASHGAPAMAQTTPGKGACETIDSQVLPVSICLDEAVWSLGNTEGEKEHSFRRKDHEHYLLVITEKDYFPQKTLRDAILVNAQNAAGLKKIEVRNELTANVGGRIFDRIVYRASIDGLDVTYDNYYLGLEGAGSVQFVFFSLTDEYEAFKPVIEQTAQGIAVKQ